MAIFQVAFAEILRTSLSDVLRMTGIATSVREIVRPAKLAPYWPFASNVFQRAQASVRALLFAALASGASPARMKP
jgi:hypothetical protein